MGKEYRGDMMKKGIGILVVIISMLALVGYKGKSDTTTTTAYFEYKGLEENQLGAIAFLGYGKDELNKNLKQYSDFYKEDLPLEWLKTRTIINAGGDEAYLIIPRKSAQLSINKVNIDTAFNTTIGDWLLTTQEPVIVFCNISDLVSNIEVTICLEKISQTFSPRVSLKDGKINSPSMKDLTIYKDKNLNSNQLGK